jgi:hypothetical protein
MSETWYRVVTYDPYIQAVPNVIKVTANQIKYIDKRFGPDGRATTESKYSTYSSLHPTFVEAKAEAIERERRTIARAQKQIEEAKALIAKLSLMEKK